MIVVTSPTGYIGGEVLRQLVENDEPIRVIARDPERLASPIRPRVDVVTGSHRDPAVIDRAFDGADAVFWLVPAAHDAPSIYDAYVGFSLPAADAIVRHGIAHVVTVSALGRGTGLYGGHASASVAMDDLIRSTGTNLRALANATFMDNVSRQSAALQHDGVLTGTLPADVALPMVARKDIAANAVRLLSDRSWTGQESLGLYGPEDLSQDDVARILSEVLRRPIRYERGDRDADKAAFLAYGLSPAVAQALIDMDVAKERGLDTLEPRSSAVSTPTTFRGWAEESFGSLAREGQ